MRSGKAKWLQEQRASVKERLKRNNSRKACQLIKTLRKNFQLKLRSIKDAEHRILTYLKDILRRWRKYAENLYCDQNNLTDDNSNQSPTPFILESKTEEVIQILSISNAIEIDDLPAKLLKTDNQQMTKIICQLSIKI